MKTVLIILGILISILLIGLVWPLLIAGGIAYALFSSGSISWPMAFTGMYIINKERKKDS